MDRLQLGPRPPPILDPAPGAQREGWGISANEAMSDGPTRLRSLLVHDSDSRA